MGDTPSRVAEAANFAKKHLGCKIMQSTPYYRTDGHLQVRHSFMHAPPSGCIASTVYGLWADWPEKFLLELMQPQEPP